MQDSTAAIQSDDSTQLPNIRIQQNSFEMCTAKLYWTFNKIHLKCAQQNCIGHSTDTALSIDTRNNTKYWKVWQLTYNGYEDL